MYIVHVRIIYSKRDYQIEEVNNTRRIILLGMLAMAILLSPFLMVPVAAAVNDSFNYDEFIDEDVPKAGIVPTVGGVNDSIYDEFLNEDVPKAAIIPTVDEIDCSSYPAITTADCLNQGGPSPKPVATSAAFEDYP